MPERFGSNPEEENKISRRDFLKKSAVLGAGLVLAPKFLEGSELSVDAHIRELESEAETTTEFAAEKLEQNRITSYATGKLEGHICSPYFSRLTGIPEGKIGKNVTIQFTDQLDKLWDIKSERGHHKRKGKYDGFENTVAEQTGEKLVSEYKHRNKGKTNLKNYAQHIENVLHEVRKNDLNWKKIPELLGLEEEQATLLHQIASVTTGKDILAYSMTELMGSEDGAFNAEVYDFLLRNAGTRYINSIPALYDSMTSFGPYQLTSLAFYDPNLRKEIGIGILNHAMTTNKVPVSIANIRGDNHHRGAYLFAIYNLAEMINSLSDKEFKFFKENWREHHHEVVEYIATAHHAPGSARQAAKRWIDGKMKHDYAVSCGSNIDVYARRTKNNLKELNKKHA